MAETQELTAPSTPPPMPDPTPELKAGMTKDFKEGKTLIDRLNENTTLRPEVAEAFVRVLDSMVARMKNHRSNVGNRMEECQAEIAMIDKEISMMQPRLDAVKQVMDVKVAEREKLQKEVVEFTDELTGVMTGARKLLADTHKSHKKIQTDIGKKMLEHNRGYTQKGEPGGPRTAENALKRPVRARRPGDMTLDLDKK